MEAFLVVPDHWLGYIDYLLVHRVTIVITTQTLTEKLNDVSTYKLTNHNLKTLSHLLFALLCCHLHLLTTTDRCSFVRNVSSLGVVCWHGQVY